MSHLHFLIRVLLLVTLIGSGGAVPNLARAYADGRSSVTTIGSTERANRTMLGWLAAKEAQIKAWMQTRGQADGMPDGIDFYLVQEKVKISARTANEEAVAKATKELYDQYFPPDQKSSLIGTFVESANPAIDTPKGPYRWDSHWASQLEEPGIFDSVTQRLVQNEIKSIRIGPNFYDLEKGNLRSWDKFVKKVESIWDAGGVPTISIAFFPNLEKWKTLDRNGNVDVQRSYLLHPDWPSDVGQMTKDLVRLLQQKAKLRTDSPKFAINPINEPETLAGFNRQFWHGAHEGWGSPRMMSLYVPSVLQIAKAAVAVRAAVEEEAKGTRVLFMHNEAMTPEYYPSHRGAGRFAVSKFMLGDDLLLNTDFAELAAMPIAQLRERLEKSETNGRLNEVEWSIQEFVFGSWNSTEVEQIASLRSLTDSFIELQRAHANLKARFGKTMKTDTVLALDYYIQSEFGIRQMDASIYRRLGEHQGAWLKEVLGGVDDETCLRILRDTAKVASGFGALDTIIPATGDLSSIDLAKAMRAEGSVLTELIFGLRAEWGFANDPISVERRNKITHFSKHFWRLDEVIDTVTANGGSELRRVLNVNTDQELREALQKLDQDSLGPFDTPTTGLKSLRDILNHDDRRVLKRVFGMSQNRRLNFEPQFYARQLRLGLREGFARTGAEYVNNLRLHTIAVGESGTPYYYFAGLLHDQIMMEYAHLLKAGVYGTRYDIGPAVDTRGWAKGPLNHHYDDDNEINPSGIYSVVGEQKKRVEERRSSDRPHSWIRTFLDDFFKNAGY